MMRMRMGEMVTKLGAERASRAVVERASSGGAGGALIGQLRLLGRHCFKRARRFKIFGPIFLGSMIGLGSLGGCVSIGEAGDPPQSLLTLTASQKIGGTSGGRAQAIDGAVEGASWNVSGNDSLKLAPISVPKKLDIRRIPVQVNPGEIAYLKEAVWVDRPARLFGHVLAETLRASGRWLVVEEAGSPVSANRHLGGALREFGYDRASSSVIVRFDALRKMPGSGGGSGGETAQMRRFESRVNGVAPDAQAVGRALNVAANEVAGEVTLWMNSGV